MKCHCLYGGSFHSSITQQKKTIIHHTHDTSQFNQKIILGKLCELKLMENVHTLLDSSTSFGKINNISIKNKFQDIENTLNFKENSK